MQQDDFIIFSGLKFLRKLEKKSFEFPFILFLMRKKIIYQNNIKKIRQFKNEF